MSGSRDSITIGGKKAYTEPLTPHRLALAVLINEFFKVRETDLNRELSKQHIRDFCVLILKLIQSPDLTREELLEVLTSGKYLTHQEVIHGFNSTLKHLNEDGIDYLLNVIDNIGKLILRDSDTVVNKLMAQINKKSVIGYYLRRLLLNFDKLTFSDVSGVVGSFQRYYSYEMKEEKVGINRKLNLVYYDDWYSNRDQWSKRQAELFIASQAALLSNNEEKAFNPKELGKHIRNLIKTNPDLAEAHFLNYLNYLRVKEFCGAINSLFHCFDKSGFVDSKGNVDEQSKAFRFAALNLAVLYFHFGHREEALAALKEAIMMAQQSNDNVCLQHALSWLYCLTHANKEKLLEHSILKSLDLNLPYIVSLGIQSFVQYAGISGGTPKYIFETITRSDIVNCQHAYGDLTCTSYAQKSGMWLFYGKTEMSSLWSQLLLHLNPDSNPLGVTYFGEALCQSICNVAMHLLNQGDYFKAETVLLLAKERFPREPLSHIWLLCECIFTFMHCLYHEEWSEAEAAAQRMSVYDDCESQLRLTELFLQKRDFSAAHKSISKLIDGHNDSQFRLRIDYHIRAMILFSEIRYTSSFPNVFPPVALHACLAYASDFHVDYLSALTYLHLANVLYLMKLSAQALKLLDLCLFHVLTHGGHYDRARAMLLYVKCIVANSVIVCKEERKIIVANAAGMLNKVVVNFMKVEAYARVKSVLHLQACLYNEVNMINERNKCSLEFRLLEEDVICKELAQRGHSVTVLSPYKEEHVHENYKQIIVTGINEKMAAFRSGIFDVVQGSVVQQIINLDELGILMTEQTLTHTNVQNFFKTNQQFDLVILQNFMSDAYTGFCYHFNAPCVLASAMSAPSFIHRKIGNPSSPSYIPQLHVNFLAKMNFYQRFYNIFIYIVIELSHYLYVYPKQNDILQKYFPGAPHLDKLSYNYSLILVNSHVSINDVAPILPNVIEIGGAHINTTTSLPPHLQKFLDNAKDGVIYFSMGSVLRSQYFSLDKRDAMLKVFSRLKQKILWKWDDNLLNKPTNVITSSWVPQQDVLGRNMKKAEHAGYGKCIPYSDLNEESFGETIQEILRNPKCTIVISLNLLYRFMHIRYKENAKKRSMIMHDEPIKPLEKAIFWIEYVLRHRGATHLKLEALNLSCSVICKELAQRGHSVTVLSSYKEEHVHENYKQILLPGMTEKLAAFRSRIFDDAHGNILQWIINVDELGILMTEQTLNHTEVKKFFGTKQQFDLVILQNFMSDAYTGFCYHFNAPCVLASAMSAPSFIHRKIGNPSSPSYIPQLHVNFLAKMNFYQRFYNTFIYVVMELRHYLYIHPKQNDILQKYFPGAPHLDKLSYNYSLILVNSHVSINDVAPVLPNLIEIGGAHIKTTISLPPHLQEFLDNAKDGVIYFSMGTLLKSQYFSTDKRDAILKVFSRLKQKILWKWTDNLLDKPTNVITSSWVPQQDVLAHPNVVLFITHGGIMSTIEAVHNGVPILGIPVFSDQGLNMKKAEHAGYGKCIHYLDLNEESFDKTVQEMLRNPKYKENAKKRSMIMHDEPIKPLEKAIFWIEYVLRHKGATHLKSEALNLSWYQYHLLDVILTTIVALFLILRLIIVIFKCIIKLCGYKQKLKVS
ncbi:hypothetical protein FQA39_LY15190 [Lamprigera yunnana]|nr:hypothetical protein FQA39_LY15190 [Lamprigera yunnana]